MVRYISGGLMDVQKFVAIAERSSFPIDLTSGRYTVDAKSLMGIFSLDLMQPIKLIAHGDDTELFAQLEKFKA
ncbi:MAG: serine kinase [Firmicutes bacterium HGW-Firmicutes-21]|nr:MAG: serine kinase [Firmicutes bacterium HGW-Firmicutes-21]